MRARRVQRVRVDVDRDRAPARVTMRASARVPSAVIRNTVRALAVAALVALARALVADDGALWRIRDDGRGRRRRRDDDARAIDAMARVLCAWALTYYGFLFNQSCVALEAHAEMTREARAKGTEAPKLLAVKYGRVSCARVLVSARTVGNFIEQSLALMPGLFAHFYVFGGLRAIRAAWLWLVVRWLYPVAYSYGLPWVFFVTVPNYACVFGMYIELARHAKLL